MYNKTPQKTTKTHRIVFLMSTRRVITKSLPIGGGGATMIINDIDQKFRRTIFMSVGKAYGDMKDVTSFFPISYDICLKAYHIT